VVQAASQQQSVLQLTPRRLLSGASCMRESMLLQAACVGADMTCAQYCALDE
jgi:hypothetical protein